MNNINNEKEVIRENEEIATELWSIEAWGDFRIVEFEKCKIIPNTLVLLQFLFSLIPNYTRKFLLIWGLSINNCIITLINLNFMCN